MLQTKQVCAQWRADVQVQPWTSRSGKSNMGPDICPIAQAE
jgi:hypothetical protein